MADWVVSQCWIKTCTSRLHCAVLSIAKLHLGGAGNSTNVINVLLREYWTSNMSIWFKRCSMDSWDNIICTNLCVYFLASWLLERREKRKKFKQPVRSRLLFCCVTYLFLCGILLWCFQCCSSLSICERKEMYFFRRNSSFCTGNNTAKSMKRIT